MARAVISIVTIENDNKNFVIEIKPHKSLSILHA